MLTTSDLLMTEAQLAAFTAQLASADQPDPLAVICEEESARVDLVCAAYELPAPWVRRIARALAIFAIYSRTAQEIPKQVRDGYDEAMKDLTDIRDGKYGNLLKSGATTASSANLPASVERDLAFTRDNQAGL